ncbi:unnamed protein product [Clavelina lepadiformis]|uniref:Fibronectin type-I domain-containing protein n=1 Tax=Clavelina lepadiformis TaxID=159417 RepID=A0ABP0GKB7_CLALP
MKNLYFVFFLVSCVKLIHAMSETCTTSTSHLYSNRMSFRSTKSDGSSYYCTCRGRDCSSMTCNKETFAIPVQPGEGEGGITGEVPYQGVGRCYDETSGRYFERGATFTRMPTSTDVRKTCTCPSRGRPEITCRIAGCGTATKPSRSRVERRYYNGCYDVWNQEEYRSGSSYDRTRPMDDGGRLNGTYRCGCRYGTMRCAATDIPCCDLDTGEFADLDERFTTMQGGVKMNCTCKRERGRYESCDRYDGRNFNTGRVYGYGRRPNRIPVNQGTRYRPTSGFSRRMTCRDVATGQAYNVGDTYEENRGSQGVWLCLCMGNGPTCTTSRTSGRIYRVGRP